MRIFSSPTREPAPPRRLVLLAVRVAISAVALWVVFGHADLGELASSVAAAGALPIVLTLSVYLASQMISAIRWLLIARAAGFALRPRTAVTYYFIGMFFNFLGPSLLGGDVVRSLYLASGRSRMVGAAATVAYDRYVGFVWLAVLASAAQLVFGTFSIPDRLVWATHALAIVALISWFLLPAVAARRVPPGFFRARTIVSAVSMVFHVVQIAGAIVLAQAVSPTTPWRYCFVFHPLVAIVSALPISVAGLGVRESGYVYFLASVQDAPVGHARAFAVAWLAVVTAASAIGGVVFLLSGGRLPRDSAESADADHAAQLPPSS